MKMTNNTSTLLKQADAMLDKGMMQEATDLYSLICKNDPSATDAWLMLGMIHGDAGNFNEAIRNLEKCLEIEPATPDAHYSLARVYLHLENVEQAYLHAAQATVDESYSAAWLLRAVLSSQRGEHAEAELCASKVIQQTPEDVEGYLNIAHAQSKLDKLTDAKKMLEVAQRIAPERIDAIHMYAYVCEQLHEIPEAESSYKKLCRIAGMEHIGHVGVSRARIHSSDEAEAISHAMSALEFMPDHADTVFHYAQLLQFLNRHEESLPFFSKALQLAPGNALFLEHYAETKQDLGKLDEAVELYAQVLCHSDSSAVQIKSALATPVIMESSEQIGHSRRTLLENIARLREQKLRIDNPASSIAKLPFYTVYHGLNDLEVNRSLADFYLESAPILNYAASHIDTSRANKSRIVVGFISRFFCTHTIGQVMEGIIANLSRELFEVVLITFPYPNDPLAARMVASADRVAFLPHDWRQAHEIIANQKLDILFYTDIGMDPYTYFLAYARLAPVQCTTWGHAVTTGIPNIDYYLTCGTFEPEGAESHYSEKLIRLSAAPTFYPRPRRAHTDKCLTPLASDKSKNSYLCPQVLFKFHPDFDKFLGGILQEDTNGEIILLECRHQSWRNLLMHRLNKTLPDVVDRIKVLPYPGPTGYLKMIETCDVMLDTYHYGGGSTSLQALGLGTPIVTMPGNFQRGRHTYSYYSTMKMMDCVVNSREDYIELALRIGKNKDYRNALSKKIGNRSEVLFSNSIILQELETFFMESVNSLS